MTKFNYSRSHRQRSHTPPEFQRRCVWNPDQVRGLFDSLYDRHPVGGLLVLATVSQMAAYRGNGSLAAAIVKLLLVGQQRIAAAMDRSHFSWNP